MPRAIGSIPAKLESSHQESRVPKKKRLPFGKGPGQQKIRCLQTRKCENERNQSFPVPLRRERADYVGSIPAKSESFPKKKSPQPKKNQHMVGSLKPKKERMGKNKNKTELNAFLPKKKKTAVIDTIPILI